MNAKQRSPGRESSALLHAWVRPSRARLSQFLWKLLLVGAVAFHAVILLGAIAVPGYAIAEALAAALTAPDGGQVVTLVSVHRWLVLLGNTAVVCGVALLTALAIGLTVGILVARTDMTGRFVFGGLAVLLACVPVYVTMTFVLAYLPIPHLAESTIASGLLYGLIYAPLATIVLAATFRCVDRELEDLARLDAGPRSVLLRVTIPQAGWGIAMLGLLILLLAATDFTVTAVLFVRTFAEEVYTQYELHRSAAGPVLTSIPMLLVFAALLVVIQVRYRLLGEQTPWHFGTPPPTFSLGPWRPAAAVVLAAFVVVLIGRPTAALLGQIGSVRDFAADASNFQSTLVVSLLLAASGAVVIVVASVGLAVTMLRAGRLRWLIAAAVVLLLATPAPVVGISLIGLLNRPGLLGVIYDSPATTVIGYVVRFLPIGVLLLAAAVQRVPRELEAAARIDGCDWLGVQRHVYWPAVLADAAIAGLVVVILAFAEVATTKLVYAPGYETAAVWAFTLLHSGVYRDLAVLAVLSIGFILVPWLMLIVLLRWRFAPRASA
jgi:iron(III) transport system permease protein